MDGGVEMTMTQVHIDVQKRDFGVGGVSSELGGIVAIEVFKKLGEGGGISRPKEENIIDKTQPEAGFLES